MPKAKVKSDSANAKNVASYDKLIATVPEIERKGAGTPYTAMNGHMFTYLHESGVMALRLPGEAIEPFLKKYKTTLMRAYGIVQKEYVSVPPALLEKTAELKKYLKMSFDYVKSLKPKATTRKAK